MTVVWGRIRMMLQDLRAAAWQWYSVVRLSVETKPRISRVVITARFPAQ